MTQRIKLLASLALLAGLFSVNAASAKDIYPLEGQHQFTWTIGGLADNDYEDYQAISSFDYTYWTSDSVGFSVTMGGVTSDWDDDDDYCCDRHHDDDGVGIVQFGMELRPQFLNVSDKVYFTVKGMVGPYIGVNENGYYYNEDHYDHDHYYWEDDTDTETKWGAYLALNLNVAVSKRFVIGASAGYHFVDELDTPVNGERDYNSPDFRLRFSFLL